MNETAMIEAVRAVGGVNGPQGVYAAGSAAPAMDPAAVDAFQAAMAADGPTKADPIPFVDEVSRAWRTAQVTDQDHLHRVRDIALSGGSLSPMELAAMQYELATLGFNLDITMSVAKKTSDAVTTLIKNG